MYKNQIVVTCCLASCGECTGSYSGLGIRVRCLCDCHVRNSRVDNNLALIQAKQQIKNNGGIMELKKLLQSGPTGGTESQTATTEPNGTGDSNG